MTPRPSIAIGRRRPLTARPEDVPVISLASERQRRALARIAAGATKAVPTTPADDVACKVLQFPGGQAAGGKHTEVAKPRTIMLVDDSATSLLWQRMILKEEPYALVTATSAEEALAMVSKHRPDLIIMDVEMPGAGGLAGCRALRAATITRGVPIILLSTRVGMADAVSGVDRGLCDAAIAKPIDREDLLRAVRSHLPARTA